MKGQEYKIHENKLLTYLKNLPTPVGVETPDVSTVKIPPFNLVST